jgi:hypothetical protein
MTVIDICDLLKMDSEAAKSTSSQLGRDDQILLWDRLKQVIKHLGEIESDLRKEIVAANFNPEKVEGTETLQLGAGWALKVTKTQTYKVTGDNDAIMSVEVELPNWLEDLFRWKSEISTSKYKQLISTVAGNPDDEKSAELLRQIDSLIEIKPGSPQLSLQAPKEKA